MENASVEVAVEAMRRAGAIERYLKTREHKAAAQRAARVLETAVGEALGPACMPGRPAKNVDREQHLLSRDLESRFRRLAAFRSLWWPALDEKPLSRSQALNLIDEALRQDDAPGETCTVEDLDALVASGKTFGTVYIDPASLVVEDGQSVPLLANRLRCSRCGARNDAVRYVVWCRPDVRVVLISDRRDNL